jgi:hypothetical protein
MEQAMSRSHSAIDVDAAPAEFAASLVSLNTWYSVPVQPCSL